MLGTSLFIRCTQHSVYHPALSLVKTYSIDDKAGKIYRKPYYIACETDKYMDFVIYPDYLLRFDYASGKLITMLDSIHYNIDSLTSKTYQVINQNIFEYLPHDKASLCNANKNLYQVAPFSSSGNFYYIPVGIKTLAKFVYKKTNKSETNNSKENKTAENYAKKLREKNVDSIQRFYASANVVSEQINNFIIVTDKNFKQVNIFPLEIDCDDYYISKQKCGYCFNNVFYFSSFAKNITTASDEKTLVGYEPSSFFTAISLNRYGITGKKPIIEKKLINSEAYSMSQGLSRKVSYAVKDDQLIASMGKELINLTANTLYNHQPVLDEKEYISHLGFSNNLIVYTSEKYMKRKQISKETQAFGAVDSISNCYLNIQDMANDEIILKKELKLKIMYTLSNSGNLYEYLEKSDSLLINKYQINYND